MTSFDSGSTMLSGSTPSPRPQASLRPLATTSAGYGSAELTPEFLPGPARQLALKERQIAKAVEYVATAPRPTMEALAAELGVSRATAYRVVGMPEFQEMLRQTLTGRLAVTVQKAFSVVEDTMETGSPSLRLRAAQFLIERHDKLSAVAGAGPKVGSPSATAFGAVMIKIQLTRLKRDLALAFPEPLPAEAQAVLDRVFTVISRARGDKAEHELVDSAIDRDQSL